MSSLAAARADNFYYPPEWTPEAGSLNKFAGVPPGHLGKRAKKMDQGILVIRCVHVRRTLTPALGTARVLAARAVERARATIDKPCVALALRCCDGR